MDDTAMYHSCGSQVDLMLPLNIELSLVSKWLRANKLTLNTSKTKYMVFGSRQWLLNLEPYTLKINGENLEMVSEFKYLGVYLNESLSFDKHVDDLYGKTSN